MKLKLFFNKLRENSFLKNVLLISGSTVIGQLIILLCYPIVSRLYNVSDFGIFQLAQAILSFIIVIAAFRFELAILLPKDDKEGVNIWKLTLLVNVFLFTILFAIIGLSAICGINLKGISGLGNYIYFIPFIFLGAALYQGLVYLNLRFKNFKVIGKTKIYQSIGNSSSQLGLGVLNFGSLGLFVGDFIGRTAGIYNMVKSLPRTVREEALVINFKELKVLATIYKKFPFYNSPGALLNTAGFALPALFIGKIYGLEVLGLYALVDRVYAAPSALIGQSVSQVFMSEAATLAKSNVSLLKSNYISLLKKLALIFIVPTIIIFFFGPSLFSFVFGSQWALAGHFASILALMQFAGFVVWPMIPTLLILELQRTQLIWETARVFTMVIGFYFCYFYKLDVNYALIIYASIMFLFYVIHALISIYYLNRRR